MCSHGLNEVQLHTIKKILREHAPGIEKVCLFGSRATGTYQKHSDIDLVLYGKIDAKVEDRLWTCFYESSLPYKVDVALYQQITYPPLKRHIDWYGKGLFTKDDVYSAETRG